MDKAAILQGHATFRVVLQAMSRPGRIYPLPQTSADIPVVQLLAALLDNEVSVAIINQVSGTLGEALVRRTGCQIRGPEQADFVIAAGTPTAGMITRLKQGSLESPHGGATLLYLVEELCTTGGTITLTGPGIEGSRQLGITGMARSELHLLQQVNREFPLGIDVMLLDQKGQLACIPRSSTIGVQ